MEVTREEFSEDFMRTKYEPWAYENAEHWYRRYFAKMIECDKLAEKLSSRNISIARQAREARHGS